MKSSILGRLMLVAAAALVTMTVTACNTVEGAGKDTQKLGDSVERAADRNK